MKREYTVADFVRIVDAFRDACPEVTLSTDIIVGFPGESDDAFERTMDLVRRVGPAVGRVTRFRRRAGAPAAPAPPTVGGRRGKQPRRRAPPPCMGVLPER